MQNFEDVTRLFLKENAMVQASNALELEQTIGRPVGGRKTSRGTGPQCAQGGVRKSGGTGPHGWDDFGAAQGARSLHRPPEIILNFRRLTERK